MTPFSRCARIQEQLSWFVGGDLDEAEAGPVRDHLRDCPVCRGEASGLLQARRALLAHAEAAARSVDEAQFDVWREQILAAVAAEPEPVRASASSRTATWLAAAAMVLVAVGYVGTTPAEGFFGRAPITADTYATPSAMMQPLGQESWLLPASQIEASAPGMMGRLALRTLEDETLPFDSWTEPVVPRRPVDDRR